MSDNTRVKGYKVFRGDWTCDPTGDNPKQYSCPGKFEEDVTLIHCGRGMHFCKKAIDCFNYYSFSPEIKVAEVIAYGTVVEESYKCCTDKLEIVREISWQELLEIVNTGKGCTGLQNTGDSNKGDSNSGDSNKGNSNTGDFNAGNFNSGSFNSGNMNTGDMNTGDKNTGSCNGGNQNIGNYNSGCYNNGDYNSGDSNNGDYNSGDWNKTDFSNGCFNTVEPKIYLFNKPSEWTYKDWLNSEACNLLKSIPINTFRYISFSDMTNKEKAAHPEAETIGGYLKETDSSERIGKWWSDLPDCKKKIILSIPNFDKHIFKEITGIDVDAE